MDKERDLTYNIKLVEKYKRAIPELKKRLKEGSCHYIAGTLVLDGRDPVQNSHYTTIDMKPIGDYESEIIQEALYLASKVYLKHKTEKHHYYGMALSNVNEYEELHGCEAEPRVQ